MKSIEAGIVKELKRELEYFDTESGYSQWVLGVTVKEVEETDEVGNAVYAARVVVKTSESPYVDGEDINFAVNSKGEVSIEPSYYEQTPELQGSPIKDSIVWLKKLGCISYLQLKNPYKLEIYIDRLQDIVGEYKFTDLMEYYLDSQTGGCNLLDLYKDLIQEALRGEVEVEGSEISDGKYALKVRFGERTFGLCSKAWYKKEDVIQEIRESLLEPLIELENKEQRVEEVI